MKKTAKVSSYELSLKVDPQKEGGYVAVSPVWPDCYAQGESIDEAVLEATAVAQALIELYKEEGLHIPLKLTNESLVSKPITIPVIVAA